MSSKDQDLTTLVAGRRPVKARVYDLGNGFTARDGYDPSGAPHSPPAEPGGSLSATAPSSIASGPCERVANGPQNTARSCHP